MFVEFIIDVFHVDPDIQDGGTDAGHGKLGSHDGVADGVLISFEEKVREAREQIAHGLRHLLRDFNRFLEGFELFFLSLRQRKRTDGAQGVHQFQEGLGILIHQIEEDGAGHLKDGGIVGCFFVEFCVVFIGFCQMADHLSERTGLRAYEPGCCAAAGGRFLAAEIV